MSDKIVITGVSKALDGDYDLDLGYLTNRDFHTIKRVAGVRVGELDDALAAGDLDVVLALAVIALKRHGKTFRDDDLWDAEAGTISFVPEPEEAPTGSPPDEPKSSADNLNGGSSPAGSENLATRLSPSGIQHSATSSGSARLTSAT